MALLSALLLILTYQLAKTKREGEDEHKILFDNLAREARKAIADKDLSRLRTIYNRMRFNYYFLNEDDKIAMKEVMDWIYEKLERTL